MPTTLELPDELSEMLKDNAKYCDEINANAVLSKQREIKAADKASRLT